MIVPLNILVEIIVATDAKTQAVCHRLCKSVRKHLLEDDLTLPLRRNLWRSGMARALGEISAICVRTEEVRREVPSAGLITYHCEGVRVHKVGRLTKIVTTKAKTVFKENTITRCHARKAVEFTFKTEWAAPDGGKESICYPKCEIVESIEGVMVECASIERTHRCPRRGR